jgi:hypothetical protein
MSFGYLKSKLNLFKDRVSHKLNLLVLNTYGALLLERFVARGKITTLITSAMVWTGMTTSVFEALRKKTIGSDIII